MIGFDVLILTHMSVGKKIVHHGKALLFIFLHESLE
jgi:hypothetical protein